MPYDKLERDRMSDRRMATFCCINDTEGTYNSWGGLAFSQMFHHVRVLWDEASNTGQVPNLEKHGGGRQTEKLIFPRQAHQLPQAARAGRGM